MNLICERSKNEDLKCYAFSSFFYPKLMNYNYQMVKRWTKKVDIFSYDIILVPVHLGLHWTLSVRIFFFFCSN